MRALLLAAGLGTRLRPLTNHIPKCLVPIHGRPLLDYWLETLVDNGVEQVLINTHYMAPMVRRYLSQSTWWPYITLVHEETLLGTGGTILQNRDFFRDETFLVAHADNLTIFNFDSFVNNHSNRPVGCDMTMMVFETTDPKSCGIVELDSYGVLQSFHEKVDSPPSNLANAAVYIFEQSIIEYLILLNKLVIDISTEVIPMHTRKFFSYYNRLYHRDIGTIDSWNKANHEFPLTPHNKINNKAWLNIIGKKNIYAKVMELRS